MDPRFQLLCRAVKAWSKAVGVEGAKNARLNSFSLCLMVILYLQTGVSPAILPNLQELFPELNGDVEVTDDEYGKKRNLKAEMEKMGVRMEKNQTSIGSLFTGFLKFWSRFELVLSFLKKFENKGIRKKIQIKKNKIHLCLFSEKKTSKKK